MKKLSDNMKHQLKHLYRCSIGTTPFYPDEAGLGLLMHGPTGKALVELGLAIKVRYGYKITMQGIELAEKLGFSFRWPSQLDSSINPELAQAKVSFQTYLENADNFNAAYCANVWRKKSLDMKKKSVAEWERGGIIVNHKLHRQSNVYRYLSLLALEMAMN